MPRKRVKLKMKKNNSVINMKIFAVDNEPFNTMLIEELLKEAKFENIKVFSSAEDLLIEIFDADNIPDLILSDIMMPNMSGYELCQKIKSVEKYKHIPIIMITAASMENSEPLKKSFEYGAMDFISKPINPIEIIARVRSALSLELQRQKLIQALDEIKQLQGLLPICSYCKKVRTDDNYWDEIEHYIANHSEAKFSHSVCPDCYIKYVKPQLDELKKEKKKHDKKRKTISQHQNVFNFDLLDDLVKDN
jgi:CheY-like chemotaxis protein